jgi:predicted transcriptional regulator
MADLGQGNSGDGVARIESRRRSLLELAPLELDCMNTLWPIGEGTVREIRDLLAPRTPRAYTTIMTIMDRLARKGIVERRKAGRAYVYRPNLSADEARVHALGKVVESFFGGSRENAVGFLNGDFSSGAPVGERSSVVPAVATMPNESRPAMAKAAAAAASAAATPVSSPATMANAADGERIERVTLEATQTDAVATLPTGERAGDSPRMDDTLL